MHRLERLIPGTRPTTAEMHQNQRDILIATRIANDAMAWFELKYRPKKHGSVYLFDDSEITTNWHEMVEAAVRDVHEFIEEFVEHRWGVLLPRYKMQVIRRRALVRRTSREDRNSGAVRKYISSYSKWGRTVEEIYKRKGYADVNPHMPKEYYERQFDPSIPRQDDILMLN
jgi:adenylate kinase family enzyme